MTHNMNPSFSQSEINSKKYRKKRQQQSTSVKLFTKYISDSTKDNFNNEYSNQQQEKSNSSTFLPFIKERNNMGKLISTIDFGNNYQLPKTKVQKNLIQQSQIKPQFSSIQFLEDRTLSLKQKKSTAIQEPLNQLLSIQQSEDTQEEQNKNLDYSLFGKNPRKTEKYHTQIDSKSNYNKDDQIYKKNYQKYITKRNIITCIKDSPPLAYYQYSESCKATMKNIPSAFIVGKNQEKIYKKILENKKQQRSQKPQLQQEQFTDFYQKNQSENPLAALHNIKEKTQHYIFQQKQGWQERSNQLQQPVPFFSEDMQQIEQQIKILKKAVKQMKTNFDEHQVRQIQQQSILNLKNNEQIKLIKQEFFK